MTVKANLIMALDMQANKENPAPHERFSFREGDSWFFVERGPTYSNCYEVDLAGTDEKGMSFLRSKERKEDGDGSKDGG